MRDAQLRPRLRALWERNYSVYGRRKLTKAARKAGLDVGRDQVARLMRAEGIRGASRAKKRYTTRSDPAAVRAPDLVQRDFTATAPNHKWVADFTYCSTWSGIVYVAFITDVFSRRIVGWKAARTMTASLVLDALNMAAWTRRGVDIDGVICHSDAGSQYTSIAYTDRLEEIDAAPSIGTIGDSFDNAMAECSRPSCTATPPRSPATADPGAASTISRSRPVPGCHGSTTNASTANSTTSPPQKSKTTTTVTNLSPPRHEKPTERASGKPRPIQALGVRWWLVNRSRLWRSERFLVLAVAICLLLLASHLLSIHDDWEAGLLITASLVLWIVGTPFALVARVQWLRLAIGRQVFGSPPSPTRSGEPG